MFDWYAGWSRFPTGGEFYGTTYVRYHIAFLSLALPICILGMLGWLPHSSRLIAAWGIFWLGIFRYWLRDLQLDDEVLERVATENYLWTVPIFVFAAHAVMTLCLLELLGGAPALGFLAGYSLIAGLGLYWSVVRRSLHRRRKGMRAAATGTRSAS
jgi:hypothetical protein